MSASTPTSRDARAPKPRAGFGVRLAALRQARCLTRAELAQATGISQRMVAYYELDTPQPAGALLLEFAASLEVSTGELLGAKRVSDQASPQTARLLKRLRRVEEMSPADQRAVLELVDAMPDTRSPMQATHARPRQRHGRDAAPRAVVHGASCSHPPSQNGV